MRRQLPTLATLLPLLCSTVIAQDSSRERFFERAEKRHGEFGARAARFLIENLPPRDRDTSDAFLFENLDLAFQARRQFAWARKVEEQLFLNDVLPFAVVDETRENWRPSLFAVATEIVADCETAHDAVQALNRELFNRLDVHYNTGRKAPNQSPAESIAQSRATCTGLSILLIDACRAVGIPARLAGVANWHDKRGNHSWVEVHTGDHWHFLGADEFDSGGLDRGWFTSDAALAIAGDREFAVWATSFAVRPDGDNVDWFPMVWNRRDRTVPAVDVTRRYVPTTDQVDAASSNGAIRLVRVREAAGADRIVARLRLLNAEGSILAESETRAGRSDLNDMPELLIPIATDCVLEIEFESQVRRRPLRCDSTERAILDLNWADLGLDRETAETLVESTFESRKEELATELAEELDDERIRVGERDLRLLERTFGDEGAETHSLWISMHGGGGAPAGVNDQQWRNQIRLYELEEGIYVAPRAPTNTWNLWHEGHIDDLFGRLVDAMVATRDVDPDRVYLLGYSAGGDGVYQLAPRMADRFAAASMMAGHPNDASPLGLRNLPFAIFMGGEDAAYDRNKIAAQWGEKLAELHQDDPAGYEHRVTIYEGLGHWMNGRDAEGLPWMAAKVRNAWPTRIVWRQSNRTHDRFYWLAVDEEDRRAGSILRAEVEGQTIQLEADGVRACRLRLRDTLVDLDQPITVKIGDETVFEGNVERSEEAIRRSIRERLDRSSCATAELQVRW
ncbi:MAG: transglutaminase domain-containing protein [Planctomycetota bacterium]